MLFQRCMQIIGADCIFHSNFNVDKNMRTQLNSTLFIKHFTHHAVNPKQHPALLCLQREREKKKQNKRNEKNKQRREKCYTNLGFNRNTGTC